MQGITKSFTQPLNQKLNVFSLIFCFTWQRLSLVCVVAVVTVAWIWIWNWNWTRLWSVCAHPRLSATRWTVKNMCSQQLYTCWRDNSDPPPPSPPVIPLPHESWQTLTFLFSSAYITLTEKFDSRYHANKMTKATAQL